MTPLQRHRYQLRSQLTKKIKKQLMETGLTSSQAQKELETNQEYIELLNTNKIESMCHVHKGLCNYECKVDHKWNQDPFENYARNNNKIIPENIVVKNIKLIS